MNHNLPALPLKRSFKLSFAVIGTIFFAVGFWIVMPAQAATGINDTINFQGKLVGNTGLNVADSTYSVVFSLYSVSSAGTAIWTETQSVTTTDGIFQVQLGAITDLPGSVNFNTDNIFLGIKVGADAEMTPRVQFTAVPYAFNAQKVAGLTVTDTTGTLTIPDGKTIQFGDSFTISGANALTLTTTGTTILTLPTTGTLLTNTATANQTITSTQTSGTVLGIADTTGLTGAIVGQSLNLSGTGAFDQTGLAITLSGATGTNLNALVVNNGTSDTFKLSKAGLLMLTNGEVIDNTTDDTIILSSNAANGAGVVRIPVKSTTGDPSLNSGGNMYYNSATQKFRCYQASAWTDCIPSTNFESAQSSSATSLNGTEQSILSTTITPTTTGSKIWVMGTAEIRGDAIMATDTTLKVRRGACTTGTQVGVDIIVATTGASGDNQIGAVNFVDTPGVTTATTYNLCASASTGSPTANGRGITLYEPSGNSPTTSAAVKETDGSPIVNNLSMLEFGPTSSSSDEFIVSDQTGGVARVRIGDQVGMLNQAETATGIWNFNAGLGIGTASPLATLDVRGLSGTTPVASISGQSSFASMVVNNSGLGDIFTASNGGTTRFVIKNDGKVGIGTTVPTGKLHVNGTPVIGKALVMFNEEGDQNVLVASSSGADVFQIGRIPSAGTSGTLLNLNPGLTAMDGTDTARGLFVDFTNANHSGATNALYGIDIDTITADAEATEVGLRVNTGWDIGIRSESGISFGAQQTLPDNTTPSVAGGSHFSAANAVNRLVTNFTNGTPGQLIIIETTNANLDLDCTASSINCGTTDLTKGAVSDIFTLIYDGTNWNLISFYDASLNHSDTGTNSGEGFDLAELYVGPEGLEPGDLVSIDASSSAKVAKSNGAYDVKVMGIVSTQPGITLGTETELNTYKIGLAGRVPTKVSTESGPINAGDYLVASSIPGVAMKATKAGSTIGKALETYDGQGMGKIETFINLSWYDPRAYSPVTEGEGLAYLANTFTGFEGYNLESTDGQLVLSGKDDQHIFTIDNEGNAFFSGELTVDSLKANTIAGLDVWTSKIASLENKVASMEATLNRSNEASAAAVVVTTEAVSSSTIASESLETDNLSVAGLATVSANLRVQGNGLIEGILNVVDTLTVSNFIVNRLANFFGDVIFHSDVLFKNTAYFNADTAGHVTVAKGSDKAEVKFSKPYKSEPVINASVVTTKLDDAAFKKLSEEGVCDNETDKAVCEQIITQEALTEAMPYVIASRSIDGFTILLSQPATQDLTFSWSALAVIQAEELVVKGGDN